MPHKKVMIVAGEASGDLHGSELVEQSNQLNPDIDYFGIGGEAMRRTGVTTYIDCSELSVIGVFDVIKHIPSIFRTLKKARTLLREEKPDLLILIDYPGFNLRLAKTAKRLGIKVLFYISPQVWAWRQSRVRVIKRRVDHMAVIFPFEADFYKQKGVPVTYVGHPLAGKVVATETKEQTLTRLELDNKNTTIGLLPGSRRLEWERLMPTIIESVQTISQQIPEAQFLLLQASTISDDQIADYLTACKQPIKIIKHQRYNAINACDALIVCSGTATLEVALLEKPLVVIYKGATLTAFVLKRMIKIPFVALCNIVAGKQVARELLQENATPASISVEIIKLIKNQEYRWKILSDLTVVKDKLEGKTSSSGITNLVHKLLG